MAPTHCYSGFVLKAKVRNQEGEQLLSNQLAPVSRLPIWPVSTAQLVTLLCFAASETT